MPYSDNRYFKSNPRMLARAEGMSYFTPEGREILDGTAGLWCCNAGHGRRGDRRGDPEAGRDHGLRAHLPARPPHRLRGRGARGRDDAGRGSTASSSPTPAARARTRPSRSPSPTTGRAGSRQRVRLIGRERGYHGVGFGGMSVGGIGAEPQAVRRDAALRGPPAAHPLTPRATASRRGSRSTARNWRTCWRTWWRCTGRHHRGGDGGAGGRLHRRAGAAARAT